MFKKRKISKIFFKLLKIATKRPVAMQYLLRPLFAPTILFEVESWNIGGNPFLYSEL